MRGRILEEWIVLNGMIVLNEPNEFYTFSGMRGESDVTLVNDVKARCRFEWEIKCDWGISDHNVILIRMISECRHEIVDGKDGRVRMLTGTVTRAN